MKKLVRIKRGRSKCHKTDVYSFGYNEEQNEPLSGEDPLKLMISMQTFRSIKVSLTALRSSPPFPKRPFTTTSFYKRFHSGRNSGVSFNSLLQIGTNDVARFISACQIGRYAQSSERATAACIYSPRRAQAVSLPSRYRPIIHFLESDTYRGSVIRNACIHAEHTSIYISGQTEKVMRLNVDSLDLNDVM